MLKYVLKRLVSLIPVVFAISIVLFGMFKIMPGDPVLAMLPPDIQTPAEREYYYDIYFKKLGLDKPIYEQYVIWMGNMVNMEFGYSTNFKRPVKDVISRPLQNSIVLNTFSITISFLLSIPIGIKSAIKRHTKYDTFWQVFSLVGISLPTFFIGLILIFIFAVNFRLLPAGGMPFAINEQSLAYYIAWLRHLTLPVITLTIGSLAGTIRYVRNAMIEVISKDFIRTARSKGLSEKVIIYSHAFRNALIPVVTLVAGSLVGLFGGSAITESIFSWNGIGQVLIIALNSRDYAVVLTMNLFYAILALMANLIMDVGYAVVDPRVKLQ